MAVRVIVAEIHDVTYAEQIEISVAQRFDDIVVELFPVDIRDAVFENVLFGDELPVVHVHALLDDYHVRRRGALRNVSEIVVVRVEVLSIHLALHLQAPAVYPHLFRHAAGQGTVRSENDVGAIPPEQFLSVGSV